MKKKGVVFATQLLLVAICLTACGKTDYADTLIGVWETTSELSVLGGDTKEDTPTVEMKTVISFNDDGTGLWSIYLDNQDSSEVRGFTYEQEGENVCIDFDDGKMEKYKICISEGRMELANARSSLNLTPAD